MKLIYTLCSILLVALMVVPATGCSSWERKTFQSLAASKAVTDQAQTDYESGKIQKTQAAFDTINKAKATQTAAVNAMIVYEQVKATGGGQSALDKAQQDVAVVIADLPQLITAVKNLYTQFGGK